MIVTTDANVRAGPGTGHVARFWLSTDTEVAVTGRNAAGSLAADRTRASRVGWIFGALTDIEAESLGRAARHHARRHDGCRA